MTGSDVMMESHVAGSDVRWWYNHVTGSCVFDSHVNVLKC